MKIKFSVLRILASCLGRLSGSGRTDRQRALRHTLGWDPATWPPSGRTLVLIAVSLAAAAATWAWALRSEWQNLEDRKAEWAEPGGVMGAADSSLALPRAADGPSLQSMRLSLEHRERRLRAPGAEEDLISVVQRLNQTGVVDAGGPGTKHLHSHLAPMVLQAVRVTATPGAVSPRAGRSSEPQSVALQACGSFADIRGYLSRLVGHHPMLRLTGFSLSSAEAAMDPSRCTGLLLDLTVTRVTPADLESLRDPDRPVEAQIGLDGPSVAVGVGALASPFLAAAIPPVLHADTSDAVAPSQPALALKGTLASGAQRWAWIDGVGVTPGATPAGHPVGPIGLRLQTVGWGDVRLEWPQPGLRQPQPIVLSLPRTVIEGAGR